MKFIYNVCKGIVSLAEVAVGLFLLGCVICFVIGIRDGDAMTTGIGAVVGVVSFLIGILLAGLAEKLECKAYDADHKNSAGYSSSSSSSSSSWSSSYDYKPSQSHDSGYDDVIAAASAQEMSRATAYYGEDWPGYDPEAPQPWDKPYDPEAPQPWDTNWLDC